MVVLLQMYGRYSRQLGEFAKSQAKQQQLQQQEDLGGASDDEEEHGLKGRDEGTWRALAVRVWRRTFATRLGEDWIFLALLGIIMAVLSFAMDRGISVCNNARIWLYRDLTDRPVAQYFAWVSLPVCLILFSAGFVHLVAPQSIGSGIPEMKTILRGVALNEYLTARTLVAKVVGLTATLGSGMPLGKEGPFVHIASIVATLLGRLVTSFRGIYANESRNTEMLAAACAVGVGSCFAAPVGGVLFSIEVTTVYFAVRNYWRGFFAAVCGATVFRLLAVWFAQADTVTAMFRTSFAMDFPFDPQELVAFALIGVVCGLGGALYVWCHRRYVHLMRSSRRLSAFLQRHRFLYPGTVALVIATVSFPLGPGAYLAADLTTHDQVTTLFSNFTWSRSELTVEQLAVVRHWLPPFAQAQATTAAATGAVFFNLASFVMFTFLFSVVASTIPVPSGSFIPVFKIGAALGRMAGEAMHLAFPHGMRYGAGLTAAIVPGGYAAVGAAAFSGAVTHTISVSVIVFEMTGQITHIVPIMIAVLVSNAVASLLGPSMYDSIILIKRLPYLPDILPSSSAVYDVCVEDFMVPDVRYIWRGMTYRQLKDTLRERKLHSLPLVDSEESMVLLGSVRRPDLLSLVDGHVGRARRLRVAAERREAERAAERARTAAALQQRRPSRFQVVPAPDVLGMRPAPSETQLLGPKKSILKKTNSFTLSLLGAGVGGTSPTNTPYTTVTGAESRVRLAFEAIFKKSSQLQDVDGGTGDEQPSSPREKKQVQLPKERVIDMSSEEQRRWEDEQMSMVVDMSDLRIDPAPFQLVERTSLLKVHSLFSLVGVNHAYVTAIGRLVGVVGLTELRKAIEDANAGTDVRHTQAQAQHQDENGAESEQAALVNSNTQLPNKTT